MLGFPMRRGNYSVKQDKGLKESKQTREEGVSTDGFPADPPPSQSP